MKALDTNDLGHALLMQVNAFPVEIGVSQMQRGAIGSFQPRYYTIQINDQILSAPSESIAAVLIHELTHAGQMIDGVLKGTDIDCYAGEVKRSRLRPSTGLR